jgi:hypothetical protein
MPWRWWRLVVLVVLVPCPSFCPRVLLLPTAAGVESCAAVLTCVRGDWCVVCVVCVMM